MKDLIFMKEVNNQKLWNFELGSQESMNVLLWRTVGVQQRGRQNSQDLNNGTICRLPATSAQCILGTEINPDAATKKNRMTVIILKAMVKLKKLLNL